MDILYLLIPLSVVLVFVIGAVFWFALRSGQFDDLEGPGFRDPARRRRARRARRGRHRRSGAERPVSAMNAIFPPV